MTQAKVTVTKEEMLATRVARYEDLRAFDSESSPAFIDTVIPEFKRDLFSIIGKSVFENAEIGPAIDVAHPFSFGIIKMEPGHDGGQLDWHKGVLDRAKQHGAQLVDGELVLDEKAPA